MEYSMDFDLFTLGWLVGILEGEGSFVRGAPSSPNRVVIQCQMTDEDTIAKLAELFDTKYWSSKDNRNPNWKRLYMATLRGKKAIELMNQIKPYMSLRRQEQIQKALDSYNPLLKSKSRRKFTDEQVSKMRNMASTGMKIKDISDQLQISRRSVHRIVNENTYADVE